MQQRDDLGTGGHQMAAHGGHQDVETAFLADGDAPAEQGAGCLPQPLTVAHRAHQLGVAVAGHDPLQLRRVEAAQDAVHRQADVALEVGQGRRGQVAEDAVHPPGVEAEGRQASLQVSDVVAPEHGLAEIEEPVSQPEAGLDQGRPGLGAADAVDPQAPAVLEGLDRGPGPGAERCPSVSGAQGSADRAPAGAAGRRRPRRLSPDGEGEARRRGAYRYA